MQTIIGILLLVTYLAFIVYAAKGGNLMLGLCGAALAPWAGRSPGKR